MPNGARDTARPVFLMGNLTNAHLNMAELNMTEHYLYPGERWFGRGKMQLRTLLGSCVAITLWHPGRGIGGMCHYLLPEDPGKSRSRPLDPRYADEAMALFLKDIKHSSTCPADYQVGLFGGGNMFTTLERAWSVDIGRRNAAFGRLLLRRHGFSVAYEDLEGRTHRQIILDMRDGTLVLRRGTEHSMVLPAR
ncbi:putative chemoreceptor glutamine deamidase CheD [Gammaproteobacteria bacterium]